MQFRRYAIYHLPDDPAFAQWGAEWLNWDICRGKPTGIGEREWTHTPRRYGFHATLKAPFVPCKEVQVADISAQLTRVLSRHGPISLGKLEIARLGRFLAFVPENAPASIRSLAHDIVKSLDPFRAPFTDNEFKRRASGLGPERLANLRQWGYPHVGDLFRFHMTLTDRLADAQLEQVHAALTSHPPPLPVPFQVSSVSIVGEDEDGFFHLIERQYLSG